MTLGGLRILLAEDNLTNQMVATQMLESLGAEVTVADDGQDALDMLLAKAYDVALIDIEMPRISGVDLIRDLRTRGGRFTQMPMIALTAYVMREHRLAIHEAGADGIIAKPILSIEQLGEDVIAILNEPRAADVPPAPTSPVDPNGSVVDQDLFRELCAVFDAPRRDELMRKLSRDIGVACGQIEGAQLTSDAEMIRAASHVLISVSGTIGATRLQTLAQCLNSAGHADNSLEINRIAPALISEAGKVLEFIGQG